MVKGDSMSDTEKEIDELQRKLGTKTREIEALVADERELGDINAMESTDYARLRTYVEELIENGRRRTLIVPAPIPTCQ